MQAPVVPAAPCFGTNKEVGDMRVSCVTLHVLVQGKSKASVAIYYMQVYYMHIYAYERQTAWSCSQHLLVCRPADWYGRLHKHLGLDMTEWWWSWG